MIVFGCCACMWYASITTVSFQGINTNKILDDNKFGPLNWCVCGSDGTSEGVVS